MSACQKTTDVYLYLMLAVFPLFTGFSGYARITAAKFFFFLIATLLWLLLLAVFALRDRLKLSALLPLRAPVIAALAFAAVCLLSALLSPWFPSTLLGLGRWDGLVTTLLYVLIFLGVRCFGRLRGTHLYALGASLLLQAAVVAIQLGGGNPLGLFPDALRYADANIRYSGVFLGTIGNVDLLSAYLCLCVPLLIGAALERTLSWPLLIPAAVGAALLLVSGVAAGPLALCAGTLLCAPFLLRMRLRGKPEAQVRRYTARLLAAECVLLLAALAALYFYPGKSGTVYELSRVLHGELRESFGSSRIRIWRETLALVPERPWLGGGPGTLAARLQIEFSRFVPETGKTLKSFVDNAHNVYLGILADTGLLGLLAYLALLGSSVWELLKDPRAELVPAVGYALVCCWIADFFGLGLCLTAPMLWIVWGLAGARVRPDVPEGSSRQAGSV